MADETVPASVKAAADALIARSMAPPPALGVALPVVLDALARAPARHELQLLLSVLLTNDCAPYRSRLAELLAGSAAPR